VQGVVRRLFPSTDFWPRMRPPAGSASPAGNKSGSP